MVNVLTQARKYTVKMFASAPDRFIQRLREQAFIVVIGTQTLSDYMVEPNRKNQIRLYHLERKADDVRYQLIDELNRSFVTPIDREDLFALSRAIDDIIDFAYSIVNEMTILKLAPNENLITMADILHKSAIEIHEAIQHLDDEPRSATPHTLQVRNLSTQMEMIYARALSSLFATPDSLDSIIDIMKRMEIYRHMFRAIRSAKQASDIIGDILIKFF